jgi:PleD family two-component response regulator
MAHTFKLFLRDCLNHPEIRRSVALEKFLAIQNYDDFKDQQKNVENSLFKKDIRVLISKKTLELDNLSEFPLELFKTKSGMVGQSELRLILRYQGTLRNSSILTRSI